MITRFLRSPWHSFWLLKPSSLIFGCGSLTPVKPHLALSPLSSLSNNHETPRLHGSMTIFACTDR